MPIIPKVNYARATNVSTRGWLDWFLWDSITPGYTAVFMVLTAAWYLYKAWTTDNPDKKEIYYEATIAFASWGLFNAACYVYLAYRHNTGGITK